MTTELSEPFSYQPPPGGDIALKSADGVVFLAHSVLLGMASPVFGGMLSIATQRDLVELSDDAESLSLMLRFIYPPTFLDDLPLALLEKSLRIAQKYDVSGIITSVDHLIMFHPSNEDSLIHSDAIRTYCLAATYGLRNTKRAATEALRPENFHFNSSEEIKPLAETFPSAAGTIGLLGAHCVRAQALSELLFGGRLKDYLPSTEEGEHDENTMMCAKCFRGTFRVSGMRTFYRPVWIAYWTIMAFDQLTTQPYDACANLFRSGALDLIEPKQGVCQDCIEAARNADEGYVFLDWAQEIQRQVKKIFDDIETLYNL